MTVQDTKFWVMVKENPEDAGTVVAAALGLVKVLAAMVQPYMPATTRLMLEMLNGPWEWTSLAESFERDIGNLQDALPVGHQLGKPSLLFTKIEEDTVANLQTRFSGQQAS
jgi:methionyl-tRNA synthetase